MINFLSSCHDWMRAGRGLLAAWTMVLVVAVAPLSAQAQVTWDANTTTSGPQDGSGTWSTSDANWWNGTTDVVWPNLTTSSAIIGANNGAAGTITTSGSLTLNAITFNTPGSGAYTLTGGTLGFAGSSPTITANANATIGSAITSGAGLTKSGTGTLTLSGIVSNTAGTMTINRGAVTLTGTLTNTASGQFNIGGSNGGLLTIAGGSMSTSWSNARAIVIAPGVTQSGTIAVSSGALSASGLLISEDSGGNGVFTQSGGTVSIGGGNLWLSGNTSSLTVSGGSFTNNNATQFAVGTTNPSTSTISVSGSGSITLGTLSWGNFSRNGFTATLNVGDGTAGGTFQVNSISSGATSVASTINFNSGTFVANGTFTMPSQISTVVKAGGANISVASAQTLTLGRPLSDDGGGGVLRKLGAGTLSLTGSNTYTGTTSIAAGSLSIGNALALQNSTLDLNASDTGTVSAISQNSTFGGLSGSRNLDMLTRTLSIGNNNASTTYSGTLTNGTLTKIGSGTLTLTASNAYAGPLTISAGALSLSTAGSLASTGTVAIAGAGAMFDISAASAGRTIGMLTGTAGSSVALGANSLTVGDATSGTFAGGIGGTGGLTKQGAGALGLSGSNSYSGGTTINSGSIMLSGAGTLGSGTAGLTFGGGALDLGGLGISAGNVSITSVPASGNQIQNGTLTGTAFSVSNASGVSTISASLAGVGAALSKSNAGTLVLSGSNSFSGGVMLTGGQVQIANANALGTGTFTTNVDANTSITFNLPTSGTVANNITINKPGVNRTYDIYQNQANNVTLAGNISVASGNGNAFRLGGGVTSGTFTLTGSNTFGGDVGSGANITFRFGGTNAAGTSVWRPDISTKMVLLDGANFRGIMGNAVASYSMETAGTATVSGDVFNRNTANVAVNVPTGAQLTFSSNIRSEGGFTTGTFSKAGEGTWVVNNTVNQMTFNVLEGTMQVPTFAALGPSSTGVFVVLGSAGKAGTLSYTGATASSSKPFTAAAGGTAAFAVTSAAATVTLSGLIDGSGDVSFGGPGSYVLSGGISAANVFKTGTGSVTLSVGNSQADTTVNAGQLNVNHLAALGTPAGTLTMAAGTRLDNTSGAAVTVTNPKSIALGSSLIFVGSNDLDLGTGNVTLSGNTEFNISAKELTLSGDVLGAGFGITKTGTGTLRLDGLTGSSSFTGNSFVNAGTLLLEGSSILGGGTSTVVTVADGAFLQIGASAGLGDVTVV
ncbi:MAG: beta strand repeat-containing protein, partial [Planctomycetia bacterium]